mmetsp:Transcript_15660/g.44657  ORF Transcript_15660/g.44657 Transcript_15660/m.44657 type:complete len:664 (-) Transcript_15660:297-2288(-)
MSMKSSSASASSSQDRLHRMETFPDDDEGLRGKESAVHPLLSLYLDQALTDVLLTTASNASIAAHKVVLAAHSAYFRAIFAGASSRFCVENSRSVVRVENVDDETLHLLLRLMYGGDRLDALPEESQRIIPRLMDAAAYLSVDCVVEACSTYLLESLRVGNAIDVYLLSAGRPEYASVHAEAMKFIIANFSAILRSWEGAESLCQLSKDDVLHVLCGRHADCIHKGVDIVMALLLYARRGDQGLRNQQEDGSACAPLNEAGDVEDIIRRLGRETYRDEYGMALDAIRDLEREAGAPLLLSREIVDRVGVALFGPDTPRLFGATVVGADDEHGGGNARRSAFELHVDAQHRPITSGSAIIAVGGIHSGWKAVRSTELYNIDTDTWVPGPDIPTDCSFSHACTLSSGETYIPVTKSSSMLQYVAPNRPTTSPAELNPADLACQWRVVDTYDGNVIQRASSAAVALGESIHVLGGRPIAGRDCHPVSLHQCFRSGRWQTLAPMNEPRASMDVCVTLDRIWCVGGQSLRQTHASMEWYDPANDCWFTSSSKMATPRKYATVTAFTGTSPGSSQIIIMGGMNDVRTRLVSVEAYDPREGRLRELPPLPRPLSSAASCCSGYHLYIMGGRVDRQGTETDAMWSYDVRGGSWTACRSMRQARSSSCCFLA